MFSRLGHAVYRYRWWIIAGWILIVGTSLPLAPRVTSILKPGGFASEGLEAGRASKILGAQFGYHTNSVVAVFQSAPDTSGDPSFQTSIEHILNRLTALDGVAQITSPATNPRQISKDGRTAYAIIELDARASGRNLITAIQQRLNDDTLSVFVSGAPVFYADIEDVSERDLRRAEFIAFPLGLLVLILVLRSIIAATVPVVVGGAGVVTALAAIFLVGHSSDLSIFVLNMTTMLGLGLSIDYALFLTSRFREELGQRTLEDAIATAVARAGRAVFFSGLTVITGLVGLLTFDSMMLRSLGIAGIAVVGIAGLAALTLLPAILSVLGHRVNALSLPMPRFGRFSWARLANAVMCRPLAFAVPVLAALLILGWPFLHVRLSAPDASILPSDLPSRQGIEALQRAFGEEEWSPILVVLRANDPIVTETNIGALYDFTHLLARDPRVDRVESIVDLDPRLDKQQYQILYAEPDHIGDPYARAVFGALNRGNTTVVSIVSKYPMASDQSQSLVKDIRHANPPANMHLLVGGSTATIIDYVASLYSDLPRAIALIVLATYFVLLLLFRSVLLPLKAILMNTLSIIASYGALVFIFQDGHFSHFLGFTPANFVEASLPIVLFCFLFGISMDYEVFLLSRIKEAYERTGDNVRSVAEGIERSGRIITSAAAIVVVVSGSFVAANIVLIKALGLGTAIAVLLDATIVRALLVPATMRLLGNLNWWLPFRSAPHGQNRHRRRRRRVAYALLPIGAAVLLAGFLLNAVILLPGTPTDAVATRPDGDAAGQGHPALLRGQLPPIVFPRDEAPHDALTEWWYYTGHLETVEGDHYGFELVAFQSVRGDAPVGYAAHFAISDAQAGRFRYDQRSSVGSQIGRTEGFDLRVADWQVRGENGVDQLNARMDEYALELALYDTKAPVLHMSNGIVSFGLAGDSYYYSRTRMAATGTLLVDGVAKPVTGSAWMDHQWGNFIVSNRGGWDWFALQLADGSDLTISLVRSEGNQIVLAYGTHVDAQGSVTHLPREAFTVVPTDRWQSPRSGANYPSGWHIDISDIGLSLTIQPVLADQELDTRATTGTTYWEGNVRVSGTKQGLAVDGRGYVELTGYATTITYGETK